jgi:hypothetical protein
VLIGRDNNGKAIGFLTTLISNDCVVTINATQNATTITTRDRASGLVNTETFFETLPISQKS